MLRDETVDDFERPLQFGELEIGDGACVAGWNAAVALGICLCHLAERLEEADQLRLHATELLVVIGWKFAVAIRRFGDRVFQQADALLG